MKKFITVLLILVLLAGCVGGVYALTSGFKEWNPKQWGQKTPTVDTPTVPDVPTKPDETQKAQVAKAVLSNRDYTDGSGVNAQNFDRLSNPYVYNVQLFDKDGKVLDNADYDVDVSFYFLHSAPLFDESFGNKSQSVEMELIDGFYFYKASISDVVKLYTPTVFMDVESSGCYYNFYEQNMLEINIQSDLASVSALLSTKLSTASQVVIDITVDGVNVYSHNLQFSNTVTF